MSRSIARLELHGTEALYYLEPGELELGLPLFARWMFDTQREGRPLSVAGWEAWIAESGVGLSAGVADCVERTSSAVDYGALDFEYVLRQGRSGIEFGIRMNVGSPDRQWHTIAEGASLLDVLEIAHAVVRAHRDRVAHQRSTKGMGPNDVDPSLPTVWALRSVMRDLDSRIEDARALTFGMADPDAYWSQRARWLFSQPYPNLGDADGAPMDTGRITVCFNTFGAVPRDEVRTILDYVPASVAAAFLTGLQLWANHTSDIRITGYTNVNRLMYLAMNSGEERVYYIYYTPGLASALAANARRWCRDRAVTARPEDWSEDGEYIAYIQALRAVRFQPTDRCTVIGRTPGGSANSIISEALWAGAVELWGSMALVPWSLGIETAPAGSPYDMQLTW